MLRKSSRVILDSSGQGAMPLAPYLPLSEIKRRHLRPRRRREAENEEGPVVLLVVAAAAFVVALSSLYTVNEGENALVVRLGAPVGVVETPGLKVKAPFID